MPEPRPITRRTLLAGGAGALVTGVLAGCGRGGPDVAGAPTARGRTSRPSPTTPATEAAVEGAQAQLAALEAAFDGRLGVHALDVSSGTVVAHRGGERFLMCSTFKLLAVAAVLRRGATDPALLGRTVTYEASEVIDHSPVTSQHVGSGMTVSALCQAAMVPSDNTAANLLLEVLGGPGAVTSFARSLGDPVTRLDRDEPTVNRVDPTGVLYTTTPSAIAADVHHLVLGPTLSSAARTSLTGWMVACTTGVDLVRAGVPAGWRVGDKSGSGYRGEANDVAVVWPPGHGPLVVAIFTAPGDPAATVRRGLARRPAGR